MSDEFFLGLFLGTFGGPIVLVLMFLFFAVATSLPTRRHIGGGR